MAELNEKQISMLDQVCGAGNEACSLGFLRRPVSRVLLSIFSPARGKSVLLAWDSSRVAGLF